MNYRGSYRHLLRNSKAALIAGIEIYNKPQFEYREECVVILFLNAWELILKALLSKNSQSIFYPKKRKEPYRTLSWSDAFERARMFFPKDLEPLPVRRNLDLLSTYRDNAVHFYNEGDFSVLVYSLSQTSIINYKDLLEKRFGVDLGDEVNWRLLPLGIKPPIDPIEYISRSTSNREKTSDAVRQFIFELIGAAKEVETASFDTGRLLTSFDVTLRSTKKIASADVVVGVERAGTEANPLTVIRTVDPDKSHPLRQKDILAQIESLHGQPFRSYQFQAIAWKHKLKEQQQYCWVAREGVLTKYSRDEITFIKRLTKADLNAAWTDYREHVTKERWRKRS